MLFGDSVVGLHVLPILSGAATIMLTGWMTLKLGGGRFAQSLAMSAVLDCASIRCAPRPR